MGIGFGAIFLYIAVRGVDLGSVWQYMARANVLLILGASCMYAFAFFVRALRWRLLLNPVLAAPLSAMRSFHLLVFGFFMNNIIPFRVGEFLRAKVAGERLQVSRSATLATIVSERLFDGIAYGVLFLVCLLVLPFPAWARTMIIMACAVFASLFVVLMVLSRNDDSVHALLKRVTTMRWGNLISRVIVGFLSGLKVFRSARALAGVMAYSLGVWCAEACVFFIAARAFDLPLSFAQCILILVVIGLGSALPTAPGYVGTVELMGVSAAMYVGLPKDLSFAYIAAVHLIQLVVVLILGLRSLAAESITVSSLFVLNPKTNA